MQVASEGRPVQAKVTGCAKPPAGLTETVDVPVAPAVMERLAGLALMENEGGMACTVTVMAVEVEAAKLLSPPYCAVMLWAPVAKAPAEYVVTPEVFNVPMPSVVVPSRKVTVPVGVPVLPLAPVMVAVKVTLPPAVIVEAEAVSAVVVAAGAAAVVTPWFKSTTLPSRISGLPSPFRSIAREAPFTPI